MRVVRGQAGDQDGNGTGRQFGRLGLPAPLRGRHGQVQQAQAGLGIVRPVGGPEDPQRPAAQ